MSDPATFSDLARRVAETERGAHPEPEDLLAYHEGHAGEDHDRIQEHLALCAECADFVLEMKRADEQTAADLEVERALRHVRGRIDTEPSEEKPASPAPFPAAVPSASPAPAKLRWLPVAALVVAALGMAFALRQSMLLTTVESELARERGQNHSFEIAALEPTSSPTRGPEPPTVESQVRVVVLNHLASKPSATYRAELRGADDELIWTWDQMRPTRLGNFTIRWPAQEPIGPTFRIDLFRLEPNGPVREASFDGVWSE